MAISEMTRKMYALLCAVMGQCYLRNGTTEQAVIGQYIYTLNHKKRDILFLTITLTNLNRFL